MKRNQVTLIYLSLSEAMKKNVCPLLVKVRLFFLTTALMGLGVPGAYALEPPPPPPPKVFGLVGITSTQTVRIHFVNIPKLDHPPRPIQVQLRFLNSAGEPFLNSDCQPILPTEPILVPPGETASLDLDGHVLSFPDGANRLPIQPIVQILEPGDAHGIATLEIEDNASAFKLAVQFSASSVRPSICGIPSFNFGPVTLRSDERRG